MDKMERRSVPRIAGDIATELYDVKGSQLLGIGHIWNIGINCAGLETTVAMVTGSKFSFRFLLDKKYIINVSATVIREEKRERKRYFGVVFDKIDFLGVNQLQEFIQQQIQTEEEAS